MKRLAAAVACVCALGSAFLTSGCGPGLIAAGGGGVGAVFGLQSGNKKDDKKDTTPVLTTNVAPAVIVTSLTREESPAAIHYTIIDANADTCTIEVQYSTGGAFTPCFPGAGGNGTTGLSSSAGGTAHVYSWEFGADLGPDVTQGLSIRIRANDGTVTGSWSELAGLTIGNEAPVPTNITTIGTDVVLISFELVDQTADLGSLEAWYSIDQGQNFIFVDLSVGSPELIGNPPVNLLSSPSGAPGQFIWNSAASLYDYAGDVIVKLVPRDQPAGYSGPTVGSAVVTLPFFIDNSVNNPPELTLSQNFDGLFFTAAVPIDITLRDAESDAVLVAVAYSLDGGQSFEPATLVNQFVPGAAGPFIAGPSTTQYQIVWDALADLGQLAVYQNVYSNVMLALIPFDANQGDARFTGIFTLFGNAAPAVSAIQVFQTAGNLPVVITVNDVNSHPVSLAVEYSVDDQSWTPLSQASFVYGDLNNCTSSPTGVDNFFVWDSTSVLAGVNEATVYLRVTPTDHPPQATPVADLQGLAFKSAPFPIINDPTSNAPVSLDVFTTTAGGTPQVIVTVPLGGSVHLDRVINPASAVGFETFWRIVNGSGYGTLVQPGTGNSLDYATGLVTVADPGLIADGDTFILDDGIASSATFEFDTDNVVTLGNVPVTIALASGASDVAMILAAAINSQFNSTMFATTNGADVEITARVAARITNEENADPGRGNAVAMAFTGASGVVVNQLDGGDGIGWVRYDAPPTIPGTSTFVDIECFIDHPNHYKSVKKLYRLYWGEAPTSVVVTPASPTVIVGDTFQFAATVFPAGAPQAVTWELPGGPSTGTITQGGFYTAPANVPAFNPIGVRARSVNGSIFGDTQVTIQPLPSSIVVSPPADNPPLWVNPNLRLGASLQFSATVSPAAAPQGVNWRVHWNNQEWGSGNPTVGTITAGGLYTAPQNLPSPITVRIDAVSQVASGIFGSFTLTLVAPPPTSFSVTPATASVFAGGAGAQFAATNFVPANANPAVTWEISPVVGSISANGFYTPPMTSATTQIITVTARSAVATTVTASAQVTVQPNTVVLPSGVTIDPPSGLTTSAKGSPNTIQFTATVQPSGASQSVAWTFVGTPFGNISSSGLYTPAATATDRTVTLRATATTAPNPFADVTVKVSGDGRDWIEIQQLISGRGHASHVWDAVNQRLWFIGGRSETAASADTTPLWINFSGSGDTFGTYQALDALISFGVTTPNVIMAAVDPANQMLVAIVGQGTTSRARVFTLDLTKVSPPTTDWTEVSFTVNTNVPMLTGTTPYHVWWNHISNEVQVMLDRNTVYRFDRSFVSGTFNEWKVPLSTQASSLAPQEPQLATASVDGINNKVYFVGADGPSTGAATHVYTLSMAGTPTWAKLSPTAAPTTGIVNPGAYYHNNELYVFGGRAAGTFNHLDDTYRVTISGNTATWTPLTHSFEKPQPRAAPCLMRAGTGDVFMYGGMIAATGVFGDLWQMDTSTGRFTAFNPEDIVPQGRVDAAGAMDGSIGHTYGGIADFGVCNDLWEFTISGAKPHWKRLGTSGARPPALWGSGMASGAGHLLLFGGDQHRSGGNTVNTVWRYSTSTSTWTQLAPGGTPPVARREAAVGYDSTNHRLWVFGGVNNSGSLLNDLWYLDLAGGFPGTWIQVTPNNSPPDGRRGSTLGFDSAANRVMVFGGFSQISQGNSQVHAFAVSSSLWAALSAGNTGDEENVFRSAGIWDNTMRRLIHAPPVRKKLQGVVMATNGAYWQYMSSPPDHNNTTGATGLYDPSTGRYYAVFGERTLGGKPVGTNAFRFVSFLQ